MIARGARGVARAALAAELVAIVLAARFPLAIAAGIATTAALALASLVAAYGGFDDALRSGRLRRPARE